MAADSSSGKLRLKPIATLVGTGKSSATVTAIAHTYSRQSANICGSAKTEYARNATTGIVTRSS